MITPQRYRDIWGPDDNDPDIDGPDLIEERRDNEALKKPHPSFDPKRDTF